MRLSRREFGLAIFSLAASAGPALPQAPSDQGIGGTGAAPRPQGGSDRGIGGTGVIGTIRRFGSIYVNDLRIAYPAEAEVFIDGRRAGTSDMKIGHVAKTVAFGPDDGLTTSRIEISSEVIGPVETVAGNGMVVLGQTVDLRGLRQRARFKPGAFVAVHGQRRPNGVIVASLVEPRGAGPTKLAGPIVADEAGRLLIGALVLRGAPAGLAGTRVALEGRKHGDAFVVASFRSLARPFGPEVRRVSIEGFVAPSARSLGSGLSISGASAGAAPGGGSVLAVISGRVGSAGALIADRIRHDPRLQIPEQGGPAVLRPVPGTPLDGPAGRTGLGSDRPGPLRAPGGLGLPGDLHPALPDIGLPGGLLRR